MVFILDFIQSNDGSKATVSDWLSRNDFHHSSSAVAIVAWKRVHLSLSMINQIFIFDRLVANFNRLAQFGYQIWNVRFQITIEV